MVSKAGRGPWLLICAGCGHPVEGRPGETAPGRLSSALFLIGIALTAGVLFFLSAINEARRTAGEPAALEQPAAE